MAAMHKVPPKNDTDMYNALHKFLEKQPALFSGKKNIRKTSSSWTSLMLGSTSFL